MSHIIMGPSSRFLKIFQGCQGNGWQGNLMAETWGRFDWELVIEKWSMAI
jgi:hypothetical protein